MRIGTHECEHRCDEHAGEHVSIVYPGAPGKPSRATPHHLVGQVVPWDGTRARIISVNVSLDAAPCLWDPTAPAWAVRWKPIALVNEATL